METVFDKIIKRLNELAVQQDEPIYRGDQIIDYCINCNEAIEIIKQIKCEYRNGWILCNEQLPFQNKQNYEDDPEYNVIIEGAIKPTTLHYSVDGTWYDEDNNVYKVFAWQPLPKVITIQ